MFLNLSKNPLFYSLAIFLAVFLFIFNFSHKIQATEYRLDNLDRIETWQINQDINEKRSEIEELKRQIDIYQKNISAKQRELANLSNQIGTLSDSIAKVNLEIKTVQLEIETLELKIENKELKIQAKEREISDQKETIAEILRNLHNEQQKSDLLEILLLNNNFSDFMAQINRLENIQNGLVQEVEELNTVRLAMTQEKDDLQSQEKELSTLEDILDAKNESLAGQKASKNHLLKITGNQEAKFQKLLEQAKEEQEQINKDVIYLERVAREKLNRELALDALSSEGLMWPISSRVITAYFHDPEYPYRYIFEHPAIDIATPQGTPIKAVDGGYVAKVKDGGQSGYSYLMIVHGNNLSTVYGHVNQISVSADQFVSKGQIIAYTGGMPGTRGSGPFSTGPHLHLEIRLNGLPVDPLAYLP